MWRSWPIGVLLMVVFVASSLPVLYLLRRSEARKAEVATRTPAQTVERPKPSDAGVSQESPHPDERPDRRKTSPWDELPLSDCCKKASNKRKCQAEKKKLGIPDDCSMTITFEQGAAIATQTFSYDADGSRATVTDDLSDIERFADAHLSKLQAGNLAYNTPEKMKTGQTARVIARLGSDKVYISSLTAGMATDKESRTEILKTLVSVKMKMTLKGADFCYYSAEQRRAVRGRRCAYNVGMGSSA